MLETLYPSLAKNASKWRTTRDWPRESLRLCGRHNIFRRLSGLPASAEETASWTAVDQIETLIRLSQADLLTTFVITQHVGAIKRIAASDRLAQDHGTEGELRDTVLPSLLSGQQIASVGISHLTTSRLHLGRPAVAATPESGGYRLNGTIPWVTGAPEVEQIVVGATLDDQSQILVLLSPTADGVQPGKGAEMISMSASCTDAVAINDVWIPESRILSGPRENVLAGGTRRSSDAATGASTGAGGLQTSALALGLSFAALDYLRSESLKRENLVPIVQRFDQEHQALHTTILDAARGQSDFDAATIRTAANGLVQRTTSAAMTTAKGAGLMVEHPVGRWCQQAFFFLVWSCPQPVAEAHLCELVGLE